MTSVGLFQLRLHRGEHLVFIADEHGTDYVRGHVEEREHIGYPHTKECMTCARYFPLFYAVEEARRQFEADPHADFVLRIPSAR